MSIREKILKRDWRQRLNGTTSNAELEVFNTLKHAGLGAGALMNQKICLFITRPDILYPYTNNKIAIYLDGPPHKTQGTQRKDQEVTRQLTRKGYKVLRYNYTPPISKTMKKQILEDVRRELQG